MKLSLRLSSNFAMALAGVAVCGALMAGAVTAEERPPQSNDLTPVGAERAGNGKEIPVWTGGLTEAPPSHRPGGHYANPFPEDEPLFEITAANMEQYADQLTDGQKAMLQRYPSYKMRVFKTRRTAAYPEEVYAAAKKNSGSVELLQGGNGLSNFELSNPFLILDEDPQTAALQTIWNHITRYRGPNLKRVIVQATPQTSGSYTLVKFDEEVAWRHEMLKKGGDPNILIYFKQLIVSPARLAGDVLLVHETLDQIKEPRKAWVYNAGQRRVRRAPQVAYDGPGTAADGLRTADNFDMYTGAPDRYNWKLLGKKEIYIPYNNYQLHSNKLKYDDIIKAGHINQDLVRYELHRVWVVEATLKEGQRHIYARRIMYFDEDSWQASAIDHFDGRNALWRVAEAHNMQYYDVLTQWTTSEVLYDLIAGRYLVFGLSNEERDFYQFGIDSSPNEFTPAALRRSGLR